MLIPGSQQDASAFLKDSRQAKAREMEAGRESLPEGSGGES